MKSTRVFLTENIGALCHVTERLSFHYGHPVESYRLARILMDFVRHKDECVVDLGPATSYAVENYPGAYLVCVTYQGQHYVGPVNPSNGCLLTLYDVDGRYYDSAYYTYRDAVTDLVENI